jgi:hypothetical protein
MAPMSTKDNPPQNPGTPSLATVLSAYEKLYTDGELKLLSPGERRAQVDRTILRAKALEKRAEEKLRTLSL